MQHPSPAIPTLDGISAMEALWRRLRRTILPLSWSGLLGLLRWRDHLVRSDGLRRLLELHLPYRKSGGCGAALARGDDGYPVRRGSGAVTRAGDASNTGQQ